MFKLLEDEKSARQALFVYFGYEEDWRVLPFDDATQYVWTLHAEEVHYAKSARELTDEEAGNFYVNEIYTQRHLPKHVFRGADYTMILVDTHSDMNQFLQIFANDKEIK
jgi:hypothetical protein